MARVDRPQTETARHSGRALANRYLRGDGMTEFYVGYLPKAPFGIARKMKVVIVVLFRCGDNLRHWVCISSTDLRTIVFRIWEGTDV